jgi:Mlc titration factor MtfA (ptsG expression regulator)
VIWPFRRKLRAQFDESLLPGAVRHWIHMSDAQQTTVIANAGIIAADLTWEAARGMTLTDDVITTISARAAVLLLGRSPSELRARTVVVHKSTVVLTTDHAGPAAGTRSSGARHLNGQADDSGMLLLVWNVVTGGGRDGRWAYDVVIHEFAHSLDAGDGMFDGTPALEDDIRGRWAELATDRFEALRRGEDVGVMRPYGASSTAEFFAVAVETLFDRPHELFAEDQELATILVEILGVDPSSWTPRGAARF